MTWFKENWFKLITLILIGWFVLAYSYDVYESHQPKTLDEKIEQELLRR